MVLHTDVLNIYVLIDCGVPWGGVGHQGTVQINLSNSNIKYPCVVFFFVWIMAINVKNVNKLHWISNVKEKSHIFALISPDSSNIS